jgi:hypothetical protein
MIDLAQDMWKLLQERFRTTLRVVADLAESVGVPPSVTSLLQPVERAEREDREASWSSGYAPPPPAAPAAPAPVEPAPLETRSSSEESEAEPAAPDGSVSDRRAAKRRGLAPGSDLSGKVRPLRVDDEIQGSTYLARIIWCLGVSDLEGNGPLRPADMARMIMSRSPVSLEPPNVARYIRRSKPTCLGVAKSEGTSHFYKLNEEGKTLFDELFRIKK